MKRASSVLGFLILSAACATSSPQQKKMTVTHADDVAEKPAAKLDPDTVVCEYEQMVGSHIPQRLCMTVRDRELARQALQNQLAGQNTAGQKWQ